MTASDPFFFNIFYAKPSDKVQLVPPQQGTYTRPWHNQGPTCTGLGTAARSFPLACSFSLASAAYGVPPFVPSARSMLGRDRTTASDLLLCWSTLG